MPLQWLPLQQRQQQRQMPQQRSPISQALKPQQRQFLGTMDTSNRFVDEQKAKWAEEDKLKKLERDEQTNKAQELGMRIGKAMQGQQQQAMAQAAQPPAPAELTKENMPSAAMEVWKFISTLDEAGQKFYIQKLKEKEQPKGGYIESGGVRKEMPGSLGMYGYLVDGGFIDPNTDTVIKEKVEYEKGTFILQPDGSAFNTATGVTVGGKGDIPPDWGEVYTETLTEGLKHIGEIMDASWMQEMSTDEMKSYIEEKKTEYRNWIASRLYSKGMRDKAEINKLADLAIGSYDWQKAIDDSKEAGGEVIEPPVETKRDTPLNEETVAGLKRLFKANPDAINDIEAYKDEYGEANVDKALGKEIIPLPKKKTTLKSSRKKKEEYGKYKKL
jgi:hypothetical protein